MFDLHGKVAVVTGASVGLGRGFAFAMAVRALTSRSLPDARKSSTRSRKKFAPSVSNASRSSAM